MIVLKDYASFLSGWQTLVVAATLSIFGRPIPEISMTSNTVIDFIFQHHGRRMSEWNHTILNHHALQTYAEAVSDKGAVLDSCFGFVDGTVRPICRPKTNQRIVYNGRKRVHALKFQSIAIPNGLISNLYGPVGVFKYSCII